MKKRTVHLQSVCFVSLAAFLGTALVYCRTSHIPRHRALRGRAGATTPPRAANAWKWEAALQPSLRTIQGSARGLGALCQNNAFTWCTPTGGASRCSGRTRSGRCGPTTAVANVQTHSHRTQNPPFPLATPGARLVLRGALVSSIYYARPIHALRVRRRLL